MSGMSGADGWGGERVRGVGGWGESSGRWKPAKTEPYLPGQGCFELWVLACTGVRSTCTHTHTRAHTCAGLSLPCTLTLTKSVMLCAATAKRAPLCVAERKWSGVIGPGYGNAGPSAVFMLSAKGGRCGSRYHSFLTASTKDRKCLGVRKHTSFLRAQLCTSRDFFVRHKRNFFQAVSSSLFKTSAAKHLPILFSLLFFFFAFICIFHNTNQI